jgi:ribosomal protein L11
MLQIMRKEPPEVADERVKLSYVEMQFEAAKAAAPYVHPKLSAVEMNAKVTTRSLDQELAELNAANPDAEGDSPLA